jgi:hypothetical protein
MQANIVPHLLERPGVEERRDAIHPRAQTRPGEAGGDRDHVLLRDAGIQEAGTEGVTYRFECHVPEITS